jgi:hypothetical protein
LLSTAPRQLLLAVYRAAIVVTIISLFVGLTADD